MTSWEELRNSGISGARGALAKLKHGSRILAAFAAWWKEQETSSNAGPVRLHLHPSTLHLAGELRAAGLDAAADFAVTQWVAEGPIHPGVWTFSILLGESFVAEFIDRLTDASWQSPQFYGLENFGAWDAFESLLRRRLTMDTGATAAVTERLRRLVVQLKTDPVQFMGHHERLRGNIQNRVEHYADRRVSTRHGRVPSTPTSYCRVVLVGCPAGDQAFGGSNASRGHAASRLHEKLPSRPTASKAS